MPGTTDPHPGTSQGFVAKLQALVQRVTNLEIWQRSQSIPPSPWTAPTLLNSWANLAGDPVGYFKDPLGIVRLRGRVTSGSSATVALQLPAGFRPSNTAPTYPGAGVNGVTPVAAIVAIDASGDVTVYFASAVSDVGLAGVSFLAEN